VAQVGCAADTCLGQKCSAWDKCFITEMHRRAMESDIIIVNHHLFFADWHQQRLRMRRMRNPAEVGAGDF